MRYVPAFDGIRAIAVMLVFLLHLGYFRGGWVGVDIFFTLSGYLITLILVTEYETTGSISIRRFYFHRACRLLPALVLVIAVAVALALYFHDRISDTAISAVSSLLYVQDYHCALFPVDATSLAHLWSLSVEEQFYLFWPFLLILLLSFGSRDIALYAVLFLIAVVVLWRFFLLENQTSLFRVYFAFDTRMDEILIGCALALWRYRPGPSTLRLAEFALPAVIALFVVIVVKAPILGYATQSSYPLIGAATAYLIIIVASNESGILARFLSFSPLPALGRISYGIYLWHYVVWHNVIIQDSPVTGNLSVRRVIVIFVLTFAAALWSHQFVERPFLRLKSLYKPLPARMPQATAASTGGAAGRSR